ncbi:relaxase/mobilization nuclease domain-containing protein [Bradyrhizobium septentrionale]|uniref:relaxase/mobilization nuclease domain-containing protein n=1 Tax=Bradyrhizobium septentrionale TaxID=1404411 RepID=UPI003BB0F854
MIIKSKRVRARGQAVHRLIAHLANGDDNDSVDLLRGSEAQLQDWRNDALRFGREYSIRHWIIAPSQELSRDQLDEVVSRLGAEFGFDPKQAVIWMHRKDRATDRCSQHFHVLVAEVDPLSGKVMSSSHDYARHEKIAILVCKVWGIPFVAGPHAQAAARALEADGFLKAEDVLQSQKLDHGRSFSEQDHQIAKRQGFDLPRLRVLLTEALENAGSRREFEKKLAGIGLRLDEGRKGIPVVNAADGTFIGSLSRLTRFTKSELTERMKFNDRRPREEAGRPIDGRPDSRTHQAPDRVAGNALRQHGGSGAADGVNRRSTGTPYRHPKGTPLIGVLCW